MIFKEELHKLNIEYSSEIDEKFNKYYTRLIEVNEYMNLTAITEKNEVYIKHFLDSLSITDILKDNNCHTLCDVGSGAGFPSIPLAITNPELKVTIIDALNKRIKFLNELTNHLLISNVEALHFRAEDYVKDKRGYFDCVTARAVARLNILAEICMPLVKINGIFIAMKGANGSEELEEAKNAIETLGGKIELVKKMELPNNLGTREIIVIRKYKCENKKYPRQFSKIKERPL